MSDVALVAAIRERGCRHVVGSDTFREISASLFNFLPDFRHRVSAKERNVAAANSTLRTTTFEYVNRKVTYRRERNVTSITIMLR